MAYGDKYRLEHKTLYGGQWRHTIQEDGYGGGLTTINNASGYEGAVKFEWNGEEDIYAPVIPSVCELSIMAESNFQFRDLITTDPTQFRLVSEYYDGNNWLTRWIGYLVPDIYRESFTRVPYEIKLKFIDGIGLLKNIEYSTINNSPERHQVSSVLKQCLQLIDSNRTFSMYEFINIHETNTNFTSGTSVFNQHYVNEAAYKKDTRVEQDANGNNTKVQQYISAYEVITNILKSFAAKVIFSPISYTASENEAFWFFFSPNYLGKTPGTITLVPFPSGTNFDVDPRHKLATDNDINKPLIIGEDAELNFYQPKPQAIVTYEPIKNDANVIVGGNFDYPDTTSRPVGGKQIKNWSLINTNTIEKWIQKKGGVVLEGFSSSEGIQSPKSAITANSITVEGEVRQDFFPIDKAGNRLDAKFAIVLEDANSNYVYYLNWNSAYGWQFELNPSTPTQDLALKKDDNFQRNFKFEVTMPVTSGQIYAEIYGTDNFTYKSSNGLSRTVQVDTVWGKLKVNPNIDDEFNSIRNNAKVDNNANSQPYERDVFHSDGTPSTQLTAFSLGKGITPQQTGSWNVHSIDAYNNDLAHHKIVARELLKGYDSHARRLKGTLLNNHSIDASNMLIIPDNGTYYGLLFYKFIHHLQNSKVEFEAYETLYNMTNASFNDPEDGFYDNIGPVTDPPTDVGNTDGGIDNNDDLEFAPTFTTNFTLTPTTLAAIFDVCGVDSPELTLPDITKTTDEIKVTIHCPECSDKTVSIEINSANTNTNIIGQTSANCGDTIIITPIGQNTASPTWDIKTI